MGRSHGWVAVAAGVLFLGYAAASLIWTPSFDDGILELSYFAVFAVAVWVGSTLDDLSFVFRAAAFGIGINSVFAIAQWFDLEPVIKLSWYPSGLFLNANILAESSALVIAGMLATSKESNARTSSALTISAIAIALPSIILPVHRGSMIALGIAATIWLIAKLRTKLSVLALAPAIGIGGLFLLALTLKSGMSFQSASIGERLEIWRAAFDGLTWSGHGAGSFRGLFAIYAAPYADTLNLSAQHAHNDLLEIGFNYGVAAALPALGALFVLCRSHSPLRTVVVVFLVEGCFEFPLFMPVTCFLAALCLGHCARDLRGVRGNEPRR